MLNPARRGYARGRAALEASAREAGLGLVVHTTTVAEPGGPQASRALAAGARTIVAGGGDGTVRAVAAAVAGRGVPLGIVPYGTANLLARNLRLPLRRPRAAARAALIGAARPLDAGLADITFGDGLRGRDCFLVVAGLGRDAEAIARTSPRLKRRLGWLAYLRVGASLMGRPPIAMDVIAADAGPRRPAGRAEPGREKSAPLEHPCRIDAWTVLVGNCPRLPAGIAIFPDARPDDGVLDTLVAAPRGLADWARVASAGLGWPGGVRALRYGRASAVTLRPDRPRALQLDGDVVAGVAEVTLRVQPDALLVRRPAAAPRVSGRRSRPAGTP